MDIHDLAAHFSHAAPQAGGYRLRCPAHEDRQASLMLHTGRNGGLVLKCHAGCETADVLAAIGRDMSDLRGEGRGGTVTPIRSELVCEYAYTDLRGEVLYAKRRYEPKGFCWDRKLPPQADRVLYALPRLAQAKAAGEVIYVVEGEKDAETLLAKGLAATTCGSADGWLPAYTTQLAGAAHVVVIADDDAPGRKHAVKVAQALARVDIAVDVALPMAGFKDVTEQFEAGHATLDALRGLGGAPTQPPPMFACMQDVALVPATWAWRRHFALGAISYVEGDPGVSKSTVTCDLAARWSTGRPMPDGSPNPFGGPVAVAMLTAEDSLEHTMGPRLYAAGADRSKVLAITAGPDGEPFSLDREDHLAALREGIRTHGVRVLVVDPLAAFLGGNVDTFKDSSVRSAMLPLAMLAAELDIAIIVVRHFNKGTGGKAIHKGGGSIGFIGAARAAFQVSRHPDEDGQYIFANAKNNLARAQTSLTYTLVQDEKIRAVDAAFEIARVEWLGTSDLAAQDVLDAVPMDSKALGYVEVMAAAVADGQPKTWATIKEILEQAGYNPRTAEDHRDKVLEKVFGPNGNRDTKWIAKGTKPKPRRRKPAEAVLKAVKDASPNGDVCDLCSTGPALYFPTPVSGYRCQPCAGKP